jgi:GlcNAc-P-P-Und epimerase
VSLLQRKRVNKIVFMSSIAIYVFAPIVTDESGRPALFNDYGRIKF